MAEAGIASRRACEEYIRDGRVQVNGQTAQIGCVIDPETDRVTFDGNPVVCAPEKMVIALYKEKGVVCTSSDPQGRRTVQDYFLDFPARLYNVGRLDVNSEGLLLMTNDGELANRMMHPRYHVKKRYYVVCDGELTLDQAARLTNGVELEDGMTAPAHVERIRRTRTGQTSFEIVIREGRNRQIRRMLDAVGHKTLLLRREQVGPIKLGSLAPGQWRHLNERELEDLYALLR
jgi:pseudouridine synthase